MTVERETSGSGLRTVLVADDSPVFRTLAVETLKGHGLEVLEAADGSEAFRVLEARRPQLVILDAFMPMVTGFEVLKRLRDASPDYHPVVFVVTAVYKNRRWEAETRSQYKVAEYLEKPLEPEDLVRAIERHFPEFLGPGDATP